MTISIDEKIFEDENIVAEIFPGMIAQVDIIRGSRSILEYMSFKSLILLPNDFKIQSN